MASYITSGSYITVFILGLVAVILFLASSVYYYTKLDKASLLLTDRKQIETAKTTSLIFIITSVIMLCVLFIIFFIFTKKVECRF